MNQSTYTWTIKKALTTPILTMGTEKALLVLNVTLCIAFAMATHFSYHAFFAPVLFLILHVLCLQVSKADPRMIAVFKRSTRYRGFFKAIPTDASNWQRPFHSYPKEIDHA